MLIQTGIIRVKKFNQTITGGANPVIYLPAPSNKGLTLEFKQKSTTVELLNGAPRTRLLGYIPVLVAKWNVYTTNDYPGYIKGVHNGNMPELADLLGELSSPTGTLAVSPGPNAGWFNCDSIVVKPIGVLGYSNVPTGVEITFTGRDILSTMSIG